MACNFVDRSCRVAVLVSYGSTPLFPSSVMVFEAILIIPLSMFDISKFVKNRTSPTPP